VKVGRPGTPANRWLSVRRKSGYVKDETFTLDADIWAMTFPNASDVANHSIGLKIAARSL
jgi:hypothetical protein